MGTNLQRQDAIAKPDSFDDQKIGAEVANSETSSTDMGQFMEAVLSQLKRIIHGNETGNWHDDITTVFSQDASLKSLLGVNGIVDIDVACLSTDGIGDLMHVRDPRTTTGRWRVEKADCFDESKMPAVGILISKGTPTTGVMRRVGPVDIFTGLDVTKHYFVGADGTLINPAPTAPSGMVAVAQRIGIPVDSDILWLTGEIGSLFKLVG